MSLSEQSPRKILLKVSGSIAAYKAAIICSKLVQKNYSVRVVCSQNALRFVGAITFEGLTGNPVSTDTFEPGKAMDHIHLIRWANLILLYPATANTINRLASGLGDDLLSALFLAHDFQKPYIISPAMNQKMYNHPLTQQSLKKLQNMQLENTNTHPKPIPLSILPTESGSLACGEYGQGRALAPEKIISLIEEFFLSGHYTQQERHNGSPAFPAPVKKPLQILISSGGTREHIDAARCISNISTGQTGAAIAEYCTQMGHAVTFLHAQNSRLPQTPCRTHSFTSSEDLEKKIKHLLHSYSFNAVIHMAAVSDYSIKNLEINGHILTPDSAAKLPSNAESITINMKKNPKIINKLKDFSQNKAIQIVGFKLTKTKNIWQQQQQVKQLFQHASCHLVVHNDLFDKENQQHRFHIFNPKITPPISCQNPKELACKILEILESLPNREPELLHPELSKPKLLQPKLSETELSRESTEKTDSPA